VVLTYPFSDGAVLAIKGDYVNAFVTLALRTPGGTVYRPSGGTARLPASGPRVLDAPAGLLPPTSSAATGLPSTLTLRPAAPTSPSTSGSGSASGAASGSGSASASGTGSGSASGPTS